MVESALWPDMSIYSLAMWIDQSMGGKRKSKHFQSRQTLNSGTMIQISLTVSLYCD